MPNNVPVPHPLLNQIEPHRRPLPRWRLRLAAWLDHLRRKVLRREPPAARLPRSADRRRRIRSLDEWKRVAAACWADEGNLRVTLLRARLRGDRRTETVLLRSIHDVAGRARRALDELIAAQERGEICSSASQSSEALLRSVVLAWEGPPDEILYGQVVDRCRFPVVVDDGAVMAIDGLDAGERRRGRR